MLTFILSWIVIFIALFSFGDMLITLYNKLCCRNEKYNYMDTLLLGMSFLLIPLSVWSFWLPANHYFLGLSLCVSCCWWVAFRQRFRQLLGRIRAGINSLRKWQIALILFSVFLCLTAWIWEDYVFDAMYYHQQAIRWNEAYKIIPGLGNLGDRLAFNSNYLLLSSIFTFRFLLGEPVYSLQGFFAACIICWAFIELFRSGYEAKRLLFFVLFVLFYIVSVYFFQNTSTDILPNLIIFYLVARYVYNADSSNKNYLLAIVLVSVITLKLSFAAFLLFPLYLLYLLLKEKAYNVIAFCFAVSLLIVATWLIRNVILSGYLAYPISQINLFSFDWKIPEEIAIMQDEYIKIIGRGYLHNLLNLSQGYSRDPLPLLYLTWLMYLLTFFSAIPVMYKVYKRKQYRQVIITPIFIAITLTLLMWVIKGPDARFVHGVICAMLMYNFSTLAANGKKFPRLGTCLVGIVTLGFIMWSATFFVRHYNDAITNSKGEIKYEISEILYKPYPFRYASDLPSGRPHYLGDNILIYIFSHNLVLDRIPCVMNLDYTKGRFIDYTKIENRGPRIEDGFRLRE